MAVEKTELSDRNNHYCGGNGCHKTLSRLLGLVFHLRETLGHSVRSSVVALCFCFLFFFFSFFCNLFNVDLTVSLSVFVFCLKKADFPKIRFLLVLSV